MEQLENMKQPQATLTVLSSLVVVTTKSQYARLSTKHLGSNLATSEAHSSLWLFTICRQLHVTDRERTQIKYRCMYMVQPAAWPQASNLNHATAYANATVATANKRFVDAFFRFSSFVPI
jgi:hypothetical protein